MHANLCCCCLKLFDFEGDDIKRDFIKSVTWLF